MYQQTNDNQRHTSVMDIILVIAIMVIIIFIKKITGFFSTLPYGGLLNLALFLGIVGFCLYVYRQRLCSYRYTLYYEPAEGEDEFGQPYTHPYPLGTMLFERMIANKGKLYEGVTAEHFVELVPPGGQPAEKISFFNYAKLTVYRKKTAHLLVFKRKGKLWGIYFHPNEEFLEHMRQSPLYEQHGQEA